MANTSISNLAAGAAVSATDVIPNVQTAGVGPVKTTAAQLKTFMSASPTLVTPTLGVATATSINKVTLTAPATSATVTPTDGTTTILSGGTLREVLTATRNYYVRTDGSDSNNGLTNTAGGAFLTIQKAVDVAYGLDLSTYDVVINVGAGTYAAGVSAVNQYAGSGSIIISGDTATPSNVLIDTSGVCISASKGAKLSLQGLKLTSSASVACINVDYGATITLTNNMDFGACALGHHVYVHGGYFISSIAETISGTAAGAHYYSSSNGYLNCQSATWTASGSISLGFFAIASGGGVIYAFANSSSGTFTGTRYYAALNGTINTNGGGANYFPGNVAGSTATGGQYA